ncbi:unnamed protein product [marine sediment metagenome]|uniref:Uncharacterized protein n=1 Tax=marine sediment metagenome TaxID=412755 RepID=X1CTK4_9ZZZZ
MECQGYLPQQCITAPKLSEKDEWYLYEPDLEGRGKAQDNRSATQLSNDVPRTIWNKEQPVCRQFS